MPDQKTISPDTIAAAETLFGVSYTEAERALMSDNLAPQIDLAVRRRGIVLPPGSGPATRFDPRLPGFEMPHYPASTWEPRERPLPSTDEDIAFASMAELAGWVRAGNLSCLRLAEIYLRRIADLNPKLLCFARVTSERALARAAELDAMLAEKRWLGPLHGIPYGMKDIIDTAGIETDWGAEPYLGRIPADDAHITQALHNAGAVLLGKTTVGALAYGDIWHGGQTRNPWNLQEGSSGSSAGSAAAVASGLVGFAIGTETLGSIVSPATRCGATGLRPTYGRVSRRGAMALCWSLDKIGPICRTVEDTALILQALNTPDPADTFQISAPFTYPADTQIAGLRLGFYAEDFAHAEAHELDHAALSLAKNLGLNMVPLKHRDLPYDSLLGLLYAEAAAAFEELTLSSRDDLLTWQDADAWPNSFRKARFLSAVDHVQLDRLRRLVMEEMDDVFHHVDLIIGPSLIGPMLVKTNFTGHPCLCLPTGFRHLPTRDDVSLASDPQEHAKSEAPVFEVPHSIALWGRLFAEGPMLALGRALEARLGSTRRPPL